jgi:hypothetical protein
MKQSGPPTSRKLRIIRGFRIPNDENTAITLNQIPYLYAPVLSVSICLERDNFCYKLNSLPPLVINSLIHN